jgi:hypothetical protein
VELRVKLPAFCGFDCVFVLEFDEIFVLGVIVADLVIRAGGDDITLMERVLAAAPSCRPNRVVVDAHAARGTDRIAAAARRAGIPFLVDPQTHFLQDFQHATDSWAQLPFGDPRRCTPADLLLPRRLDVLAAAVVEHQLGCGATAIIAPYVHLDRPDNGWADVQVQLWRATGRYLEQQGIKVEVVAVIALGWRLLDRSTWPAALWPLIAALHDDLNPAELALAASKVDQGVRPVNRLASFVAVIRRLHRDWPVLAWQQGLLGEAAAAAGAAGYECGIGRREHCDLPAHMQTRRVPGPAPNRTARGVYTAALRRSVPKRSLAEVLRSEPRIAAQLTCLDAACCPAGQAALLSDTRAHAIAARRQGLDRVTQAAHPAWRWNHLACEATAALDLAVQINTAAQRGLKITRIDIGALEATRDYADNRRQSLRRHAA